MWPWSLALAIVAAALCSLPLIGSFRWSFRWLPLFHLCLALASASALRRTSPKQLAAAAAFLLGSSAVACLLVGSLGSTSFFGIQAVIATLWWAGTYLPLRVSRWSPALAVVLTAGATLPTLDLQRSSFAYSYPLTENLLAAGPLDRERLYLAISSSRDQLSGFQAAPGWGAILRPGNTPMLAGLRFLNGYSSFTPFGVPEWFETFGDVKPEKAQVLLSPAADGVLDLLGVDGFVVGPEYLHLSSQLGPEWQEAHRSPEATVFHRSAPRSREVRVLPLDATAPSSRLPSAQVLRQSRMGISVMLDSPPPSQLADSSTRPPAAVITFARPFLPGYRATFQGQSLPVKCYAGVIPMVIIPGTAKGELTLSFAPPSLRYGAPIALASLAGLLVGALVLRAQSHRHVQASGAA